MTPDEHAEAALPCQKVASEMIGAGCAIIDGITRHSHRCPASYRSAVAAQIREAVGEACAEMERWGIAHDDGEVINAAQCIRLRARGEQETGEKAG